MAEPSEVGVVGPSEDADGTGPADQLLAEVADGSHRALGRCYRAHGGRVFAVARRILGDDRQAERVLEAVFLGLWDHPGRFDARRGSLLFQLLCDARDRSLELLRSGDGARRRRPRDEPGAAGPLDAHERQVIELAFFEGYTSRQVADLLEVDEATVLGRIQSGLQRLGEAAAPRGMP
jgi:RNA polymerase sigma-70 factor (ECF subfamily)